MIGKIILKLNAWRLRHVEKKLEKEIKKQQKRVWKAPERTTWEREQKVFMNKILEDLIEERSKLLDVDILRGEYADLHADYLELEVSDERLLNEYYELRRKYSYAVQELRDVSELLKKFEDHTVKTTETDPSLQGKFIFGSTAG